MRFGSIKITINACSAFGNSSSLASFSKMSFHLSCPFLILSVIQVYDKEAVSHTFDSLSISASRVAAKGADTKL